VANKNLKGLNLMKTVFTLIMCFLVLTASFAWADKGTDEKIKDLEKRLMKVERKAATDRIDFTGDFRFEAHSIQTTIPDHIDGMGMQRDMVVNVWMGLNNVPDFSDPVDRYRFMEYTQSLTYEQFQQDMNTLMSGMTPEQIQQFQQSLAQANMVGSYNVDNSILYTNRLRMQMKAKVADNVGFAGRLAMYKTFGDATGVQVFNGQANTMNIDGSTSTVPNSDILRVERAYFDWRNIGGSEFYVSIGRRPSTGGPPMHLRQDEPRGGSPLGLVIDFQFDGITAGYHLTDESIVRLCYGLGYESGFGNGENLIRSSADRLKDAHFLGVNWDLYDTEDMFIQGTVARAFDVTDGFNGLVVMPYNPVTGQAMPGPVVMRFTPSANLGDIDLASLIFLREDGPVEWFASASYMKSYPEKVTTPFGGLFVDPYTPPDQIEEKDGSMFYLGARYTMPNDKTKLGFEFNHGSEYWFNFAQAADDIIAPKTNTRGSVYEAYITHRIAKKFIAKLDFMYYDYEYSGSGWHLGAPKKLADTPVLGFPTYEEAAKVALSFVARF
jgi:hypothetical protein